MAVLIDSYSESNYDGASGIYASPYQTATGQSFTGNGSILVNTKFYLRKYGYPTGNVYAKIYAHSGTYGTSSIPTGGALATSDPVDVTTISGISFGLVSFSFSGTNKIALTNGTYYISVVEYSSGSDGNGIFVGYDNSSPTHGGNRSEYYNGSWSGFGSPDAATDLCFYVYGEKIDTSERSLYTKGKSTSDSEKNIYSSGSINSNSERNLYSKGKATGNSEKNIYSRGKLTDSSERLIRSIGGGVVSSERGIYITSGTGQSERGIYSYGKPNPVAIPFYQGKNEKKYSVKIYDRAGTTFKGNYDPIGGYAFTKTINGGVGALSITLPRKFDNFGLGEDVNLQTKYRYGFRIRIQMVKRYILGMYQVLQVS